MRLDGCRIVLTGASGGIGRHLALQLAAAGGRLALVSRRGVALAEACDGLPAWDRPSFTVVADITQASGRQAVVAAATEAMGGVDLLVNNAGTLEFGAFTASEPATIEALYQTNLVAPILLTRALLPSMVAAGRGHLTFVGSILGSLALPFHANYAASKFGLRGFTEALRRELVGSGVTVTYVAPRATRTDLNSDAVYRMGEATGMHVDEPEAVAAAIVRAILGRRREVFLGRPEGFFARLNTMWPGLMDVALRRQTRVMREFVIGAPGEPS